MDIAFLHVTISLPINVINEFAFNNCDLLSGKLLVINIYMQCAHISLASLIGAAHLIGGCGLITVFYVSLSLRNLISRKLKN